MLARLLGRRPAWLGLLVVGSAPMFCMVARQAIPDMPMVACTIGALALFTLAVEDGDRPIAPLARLRGGRITLDARHVVLAIAAGFVLLQAAYYAAYFIRMPLLGVRGRVPNPAIWLPGLMGLLLLGLWRDGWRIARLPLVLIGGVIAAIVNEPMPRRRPGQGLWRHVSDDILGPWDRHALDRYLVRALLFLPMLVLAGPAPARPLPRRRGLARRRGRRSTARSRWRRSRRCARSTCSGCTSSSASACSPRARPGSPWSPPSRSSTSRAAGAGARSARARSSSSAASSS